MPVGISVKMHTQRVRRRIRSESVIYTLHMVCALRSNQEAFEETCLIVNGDRPVQFLAAILAAVSEPAVEVVEADLALA